MSALLADRVAAYVVDHPGASLADVALAVRGRRQSVKDILDSPAFSQTVGARGATLYALAGFAVPDSPAGFQQASRRGSQCDLIARVLADGGWHTTAEIHQRCGFSRLNSRIAELRSRRGMTIECQHLTGTGPEAYAYRLTPLSEPSASGTGRADGSLSGAGTTAPEDRTPPGLGDTADGAAQLTLYDALAAA